MRMNHYVSKYSWVISLATSAFMAGGVWLGVQNSERQSADNGTDIIMLKIQMAHVEQKLDDIGNYLGVPKRP